MAAPTQNDGISKKELQAETAAVTSDVQAIAQQFVTAYYQTFDTNRAALASLYHVSKRRFSMHGQFHYNNWKPYFGRDIVDVSIKVDPFPIK